MKKNIGLIPFFGLIIFLLFTAFSALALYNRPLGPSLKLISPTPGSARAAAAPSAFQPASRHQPKKTCGAKGVMNLILTGQASAMEDGHYGADAIRLARVDFDRGSAAILALPADLWVSATALDDPGIENAPLNMIYQLAYQAAEGNSEDVLARKATQTVAQTVVDSLAFIPDHYVTIRGEPFMQMVDTLGGITVTVPGDILDVPPGWSVFYRGTQTLDGKQALDYVRLLLPAESEYASLWERFDRQNQVLRALLESGLQSENWGALPELIKLSRRILVTDLSTNQAGDLACMVQEVGEEAELIQLPPEMVSRDEEGRMIPDLPAIRELIANMGQPGGPTASE